MELVEDRPGIIVLRVSGKNAAKLFQHESGGHRFQRVPPTEKRGRVQTSTVTVATLGVPSDNDLVIADKDLRWSFCRSGGSGGQHVNKTESAIRLTHIPTGVVVMCQQDRSQHRNRAIAWDLLRAKLYQRELKRREEQAAADQAAKTDIGFGHQIRSYVLQPYQMVKDLRTGVQTSDTAGVLDGDLDKFMEATLAQRAFGGGPSQVEDVD